MERSKADSVREQLFINKTGSGSKGVSIMTEAASTRGDSARDRQPVVTAKESRSRSPSIHKIRDNG